MPNQKTFITASHIGNIAEITTKIASCLESRMLTNHGTYSQQLANELKKYLEVDQISLFCNGTIALMTALKALDLKGEVITTPFTFPATIHALEWLGLTPVFCDIDAETMCIDANKIEALITSDTSAILGVHVYGMPCDVMKIQQIADQHHLKIVYDAAHSFLTKINGKHIGFYGDISMFSFHATKLFNTIEGGALIYQDRNLSEKLFLLKNFGIQQLETVILAGINGKMNEIQAIIGLENLKTLETEITKRNQLWQYYHSQLSNHQGVKLLEFPKNTTLSLQYYPIRTPYRDKIYDTLVEKNIFARKYFYPLCSNYQSYCHLPSAAQQLLPIANQASNEILCLPFYGHIDRNIAEIICQTIQNFR